MSWESLPESVKESIKERYEKDLKERRSSSNVIYHSELDGCIRKSYLRRKYPLVPDINAIMGLWRGNILHPAILKHFPRNEVPIKYPIAGTGVILSGRIDAIDKDGTVTELKTVSSIYHVQKRGFPNPWDRDRVLAYAYNWGARKARLIYVDLGGAITFEIPVDESEAEEVFEKRVRLAKLLHDCLVSETTPDPINCLELEDGGLECETFPCEYLVNGMCPGKMALKAQEEEEWDI